MLVEPVDRQTYYFGTIAASCETVYVSKACGFAVKLVQQIHIKSITNPQQIHHKSTANPQLFDFSPNPQ
jgi:hypothetical protein